MEPETYEAKIICRNCSIIIRLHIPKGTTIKDYLTKDQEVQTLVCANCGCKPRPER